MKKKREERQRTLSSLDQEPTLLGTLQISSRVSDFIPNIFGGGRDLTHEPVNLSHKITTFSFGKLFPNMVNNTLLFSSFSSFFSFTLLPSSLFFLSSFALFFLPLSSLH